MFRIRNCQRLQTDNVFFLPRQTHSGGHIRSDDSESGDIGSGETSPEISSPEPAESQPTPPVFSLFRTLRVIGINDPDNITPLVKAEEPEGPSLKNLANLGQIITERGEEWQGFLENFQQNGTLPQFLEKFSFKLMRLGS